MSHVIHKEILSTTAVGGAGTVNTTTFLNGLLREVLSSPATGTTTYTITITSPEGLTVFQTVSQVGDMADEVTIPLRGIHTISISSATVDELFNINLVIDE